MTTDEQRDLHIVLLKSLRARKDFGRQEDSLLNDARMAGHPITLPQLQVELKLLGDKNWITPMDPELGARRWLIAPVGEAKLTQNGL